MKNKGFTLIELVVVIVILGILAAIALPKFINLQDDALQAKVKANASALQAGIDLAHAKWLVLGSPSDISRRNDINITGTSTIDFTVNGWPAQSWVGVDVYLTTNNDADCLSLYIALIEDGANKAAINNSSEFIVNYEGGGACSYKLNKNIMMGFVYDSNNGKVTVL